MAKSRPYRSFRPTPSALSRVLTVEELGRIVASNNMCTISDLWWFKRGALGECTGAKLQRQIDMQLYGLHQSLLQGLGLSVVLGPAAAVSRDLPLAARDLFFVNDAPVSLVIGNESTEYRET